MSPTPTARESTQDLMKEGDRIHTSMPPPVVTGPPTVESMTTSDLQSRPGEPDMDSWRLALLGDGGVGKTALACQWALHAFVESYDPTIEDAYRKALRVDKRRCFIEVIDTAGQEEYASIRDQWMWESAAFILVFSLGSYKSLDRIRLFYQSLLRVKRIDPVIILVGNKLDQPRIVTQRDALEFAREIEATYVETSAKTAVNVHHVFTEPIARLRYKHYREKMEWVRGWLMPPQNPLLVEAPPSAMAAVAAQVAARGTPPPATPGRRASQSSVTSHKNLPSSGTIFDGAFPMRMMVRRIQGAVPHDYPGGGPRDEEALEWEDSQAAIEAPPTKGRRSRSNTVTSGRSQKGAMSPVIPATAPPPVPVMPTISSRSPLAVSNGQPYAINHFRKNSDPARQPERFTPKFKPPKPGFSLFRKKKKPKASIHSLENGRLYGGGYYGGATDPYGTQFDTTSSSTKDGCVIQ